MRGAKGVEHTLGALRETAQATQLAQGGHALAPPGDDFVRIGLVAHIPDDAVLRGVENVMQRQRQLHRAQIGAQMPTGGGHAVQEVVAQLSGQTGQGMARVAAQGRW